METTTTSLRLPGTPPRWANTAMGAMLRIPGLRRILGREFGLITVTGWRTGRAYTTPIQHLRYQGEHIVLSQRHRTWWRNIRHEPVVRLSMGGRTVSGHASIVDDEKAQEILLTCLAQNPRVAAFYGIAMNDLGEVSTADAAALLERIVVIAIRPDDG